MRERSNDSSIYSLRPRDRKQNEHPGFSAGSKLPFNSQYDAPLPIKPGRLEKWQIDILQNVFDRGIWSPGDATIEALKKSLKDRTDKQIRDWFAHRRRRLREGGVSMDRPNTQEDLTHAVEGLLLLGNDEDDMYSIIHYDPSPISCTTLLIYA